MGRGREEFRQKRICPATPDESGLRHPGLAVLREEGRLPVEALHSSFREKLCSPSVEWRQVLKGVIYSGSPRGVVWGYQGPTLL